MVCKAKHVALLVLGGDNMRLRKLITIFSVVLLVISFTACGKADNVIDVVSNIDGDSDEKEEELVLEYPLTIRVGYSTNEDDPRGVAIAQLKKQVESKTGGNILIEVYPNGELGSDAKLISSMISKDVDMTVSSAGNYAAYATKIGVSALPFLFEDFESAWEFIDSDVMKAIAPDLEQYNMHVLAYFDNGFRCVTTSDKVGAVKSVSDMEGLNIRTPDNQIVMESMSELGANPRSYPFAELKAALTDGTFDAQENPIPVIYNNKLYEEQKYLSITNHSYDAMPLTIRNDIWQALDPNYQKIIEDAAVEAQELNRGLVKNQTEDFVSKLEDEGMIITYPNLAEFKEATAGVLDVFYYVYGEDLINQIK